MELSIYNKYIGNYSDKISKMFEEIDKFEEYIHKIDISENFEIDSKKLAIKELKNGIIRYIQYNNGSLGFDIVLIKYMLKQFLGYSYIIVEEKLSEEEINSCEFEINVRTYFLLNCIYNFREKITEYFRIKYCKKKDEFIIGDDTVIKEKEKILNLLKVFFSKIKKYCDARNKIVHGIYKIKYDKLEKKLNVFTSNLNLSKDSIFDKNNDCLKEISLNDADLIDIVEEMQKIRISIIEFMLDAENNLNIEELRNKFKKEEGYSFLNNVILFKT